MGRLDQAESTIDLDALPSRHLHVLGVSFSFSRAAEVGRVIAALSTEVIPAVADRRIRPMIDSILTLEQATDAAHRIRNGQAQGKITLSIP